MDEASINPFTGRESSPMDSEFDLWCTLDHACSTIERNLTIAMSAIDARSEDYYTVARTIREQIKKVRTRAEEMEREVDRKEIQYRLTRAKYVVSFLDELGPRVEGSGALHSSGTGKHKRIEAVFAAGLPTLGKRR